MTTRVFLDGIEGTITAGGAIRIGGLEGHLVGNLTSGTIYLGGLVGTISGGVVRYGSVYGAVVDGALHLDGLRYTGTPTPPIPPVPPSGEWVTVFDEAPVPGDPDIYLGTTVRNSIAASQLVAGSKIRLTFTASVLDVYTGLDITGAYIQTVGAGDAYDFSATPVPLLVGGQAVYSIAAGDSVVTDPAVLDITGLQNLVYSMQFGDNATGFSYSADTGTGRYYKVAAADAATVNATGYTGPFDSRTTYVPKIEIFVPA